MRKQKSLDLTAALKYFFELPDWKERMLKIGGFQILCISTSLLISFTLIFLLIPCIGWFICISLVFLEAALLLLSMFFLVGYMYELTSKIAQGKSLETVEFFDNHRERVKHGAKITLAGIVYMIPVILLYAGGYALIISASFLVERTEVETASVVATSSFFFLLFAMIAFYLIILICVMYQLIYQLFIYPATLYLYYKEGTISSMFRLREVYDFIKGNAIHLLIIGAILVGAGMIFYTCLTFTGILIFLCIGLLLYPIVLAAGGTLLMHIYSHLLGQLFSIAEKK